MDAAHPEDSRKKILLALTVLFLLVSVYFGFFAVYAIAATLALYCGYALRRGHSVKSLIRLMLGGVKQSSKVFFVLASIAVMSALWRSSGLIAYLVIHGLSILYAPLFLPFAFVLCAAFSFVTGSSFACVSIAGVLLITIAKAAAGGTAQIQVLCAAGAIISGAFLGDRASFLSSSSYLTASICRIDFKTHVKNSLRELPVPFALSVIVYTLISLLLPMEKNAAKSLYELSIFFALHNVFILLPLIIVLAPVVTKIKLLHSVIMSAAAALFISVYVQGCSWQEVGRYALFGFNNGKPETAIVSGGGFASMLKPILMVSVSSALPPLIVALDIFAPLYTIFKKIALRLGTLFAALLSGLVTSFVGCSQTLAIFLQALILDTLYAKSEGEQKALAIADGAVLFSALIPWNVALAGILPMIDVPPSAALFAFYPVLQTLYALTRSSCKRNSAAVKRFPSSA